MQSRETEIEGLEGAGARVPKGGRVWRPKPNIGGTCGNPHTNSSGDSYEAVDTEIEGLEGPGARVPKGGRVWCPKPNIERNALDIGGTCGNLHTNGSGDSYEAVDTEIEGLEGPGARVPKGGRVWCLKPNIE